MDLIGKLRRCFNCRHWRTADPSAPVGVCEAGIPKGMPFWMKVGYDRQATRHSDGTDCEAYWHGGKNKPHPLDDSPQLTMSAMRDDLIPMRTYREGSIMFERGYARVLNYGKNHLIVDFLNATYHLRLRATERQRAGTIIGMEEWGVDMTKPIRRSGRTIGNLDGAEAFLARVKKGMRVPLVGLPPFDGIHKVAYVVGTTPDDVVLRVGTRGKKMRMTRTGPMAGMVTTDPLWLLDTAAANKRGEHGSQETPA